MKVNEILDGQRRQLREYAPGGMTPGPVQAQQYAGMHQGGNVQAYNLQRQLNAHGANIATDGIIGPETRAATKNFQSQNELTADGIPGSQTMAQLQQKPAVAPAVAPTTAPPVPGQSPTATWANGQPRANAAGESLGPSGMTDREFWTATFGNPAGRYAYKPSTGAVSASAPGPRLLPGSSEWFDQQGTPNGYDPHGNPIPGGGAAHGGTQPVLPPEQRSAVQQSWHGPDTATPFIQPASQPTSQPTSQSTPTTESAMNWRDFLILQDRDRRTTSGDDTQSGLIRQRVSR